MTDIKLVVAQIREAFDGNRYPGDDYLQGSFEGSEPYEEASFFKGKQDWSLLSAQALDAHYAALHFFTEEGFRFFLPAYLIADLKDQLQTADPRFHLTSGFYVTSVKIPTKTGNFLRSVGGSVLLNPNRYGAMTYEDYARYRLSVFTQEEAKAIVAYLKIVRERDAHGIHTAEIETALNTFWLNRAEHAPSKESLAKHMRDEEEFLAHISGGYSYKSQTLDGKEESTG
jgi:hypothetical protein